jgi:hypothetical protein
MHKEFVVLNAFCRIAGNEEPQHIDSLELVTFFRDNGLVANFSPLKLGSLKYSQLTGSL